MRPVHCCKISWIQIRHCRTGETIKTKFSGLGVPSKNENFKNDFFSWSEFWYWTKLKAKYVFNKYNASKRNTSLFCFFMIFRANISQVKLDKHDVTLIITQSNSFGCIYKILKETKSKYMKHQKQPTEVFCKIGLWHFNPNINSCEPADDSLGKNWYRPATLLQPNSFTESFQAYVLQTF